MSEKGAVHEPLFIVDNSEGGRQGLVVASPLINPATLPTPTDAERKPPKA